MSKNENEMNKIAKISVFFIIKQLNVTFST